MTFLDVHAHQTSTLKHKRVCPMCGDLIVRTRSSGRAVYCLPCSERRNRLSINQGQRKKGLCAFCGADLKEQGRPAHAHYCLDCRDRHFGPNSLPARAHTLVGVAVRLGFLPRPNDLRCTDCGNNAQEYDHRDYSKPLDVEPVCCSCNRKRGPAKTLAA
jgi:hypothetical protein